MFCFHLVCSDMYSRWQSNKMHMSGWNYFLFIIHEFPQCNYLFIWGVLTRCLEAYRHSFKMQVSKEENMSYGRTRPELSCFLQIKGYEVENVTYLFTVGQLLGSGPSFKQWQRGPAGRKTWHPALGSIHHTVSAVGERSPASMQGRHQDLRHVTRRQTWKMKS